jgi:hypothetical protein
MSSQNRLLKYNSMSFKHILVAFSNTLDATNTEIDNKIGKTGTTLTGSACGGKAVVVLNEFTDNRFVVLSHKNVFTFNSPFDPFTTSFCGDLTITDSVGGYFQDFLRYKVADYLSLSETHVIFNLKTYILGVKADGTVDTIRIKPLFFHIFSFVNSFASTADQNLYTLSYVADYNTFGLLPNYQKLYQMTVTNAGGVNKNVSPSTSNIDYSNLTTATENAANAVNEQTRKEAAVPMKHLGDLFKGLEHELKTQITPNNANLQSFLSQINNDYSPKILKPVQIKDGGTLPLDYSISLDEKYNDYAVDNRSLPFEQTEQSQAALGISSYTIPPGSYITKEIKNLMKMSGDVGKDAAESPSKTFKINCSCVKACDDKYHFNYKIMKYVVPENSPEGVNTGPGEAVIENLKYSFQDGEAAQDILQVHSDLISDFDLGTMEKIPNNANSKVVIGNREQITVERTPSMNFFKSGYSGLRTMTDPKLYGLERPDLNANIDNLLIANLSQTSTVTLTIIGNPDLLSDLYRNPQKVQENDADSPTYYAYVESFPMYADLTIFLHNIGEGIALKGPQKLFYNGYYHIGSVESVMYSNTFTQQLELFRTDKIV